VSKGRERCVHSCISISAVLVLILPLEQSGCLRIADIRICNFRNTQLQNGDNISFTISESRQISSSYTISKDHLVHRGPQASGESHIDQGSPKLLYVIFTHSLKVNNYVCLSNFHKVLESVLVITLILDNFCLWLAFLFFLFFSSCFRADLNYLKNALACCFAFLLVYLVILLVVCISFLSSVLPLKCIIVNFSLCENVLYHTLKVFGSKREFLFKLYLFDAAIFSFPL
jgi:hypothetical protein